MERGAFKVSLLIFPVNALHRAFVHGLFDEIFRSAFRFVHTGLFNLFVQIKYFRTNIMATAAADALFLIDIDFSTHVIHSLYHNGYRLKDLPL